MAALAAPSEDAAEGAGLRMRRSGRGQRGSASARAPGALWGAVMAALCAERRVHGDGIAS